MVFDVDSPKKNKSELEQSSYICRSCEEEYTVPNLIKEEESFFSEEERCQLRCQNCGVVIIEIWNDRSGGGIGMDEDKMTHNQFADMIAALKNDVNNVMTDEEVESLREEITELEEKIRT